MENDKIKQTLKGFLAITPFFGYMAIPKGLGEPEFCYENDLPVIHHPTLDINCYDIFGTERSLERRSLVYLDIASPNGDVYCTIPKPKTLEEEMEQYRSSDPAASA